MEQWLDGKVGTAEIILGNMDSFFYEYDEDMSNEVEGEYVLNFEFGDQSGLITISIKDGTMCDTGSYIDLYPDDVSKDPLAPFEDPLLLELFTEMLKTLNID
jgi:hypothetical protein